MEGLRKHRFSQFYKYITISSVVTRFTISRQLYICKCSTKRSNMRSKVNKNNEKQMKKEMMNWIKGIFLRAPEGVHR